jgi:1-acyl-sn-glycerol-3-phosphate acyltransferase
MTDAIMHDISLLVGELRGEQPPAARYDRPQRQAPSAGDAG